MEDNEIIKLFFERSEEALAELKNKYERYAQYIAYNILDNKEDAEECVNQAYLKMWNAIPPHTPEKLATFFGKVVRNLALDSYDRRMAAKRGNGQSVCVYEELKECLESEWNIDKVIDELAFREILNQFLRKLPKETRMIFVQRYWYFCSIKEIAEEFQISESKVKMILLRTRKKLKKKLEEEGLYI